MRQGNTTLSLDPHSGLDPLSPKHEDEFLSLGRLRGCARNEVKGCENSPVVSCLAVPRQIKTLWKTGETEPAY